MWVADYSFARPDPARLAAAGCSGVARYATGPGKAVEAAEIDAVLAAGLGIVIVQEGGNQPALAGYQAGVDDARAANRRLDQLGNYPADCWIYYVAEDPTRLPVSAWPTVDAYFHGVNTVRARPVGGYGSVDLLDHLYDQGLITRKWAVGPWGGHQGCHLSQYAAPVPPQFVNVVDANLRLADDYGQHPRPTSPPPPADVEADDVTSYFANNQHHLYRERPDGTIDHWWLDLGVRPPAWSHETLPPAK
jgi:hypothetical protein